MRLDTEHGDTRLEVRVLELEDTVALLGRITAAMADMLGRLSQIAEHYADTVTGLTAALPDPNRCPIPLWPVGTTTEFSPCPDCSGAGPQCNAAPPS